MHKVALTLVLVACTTATGLSQSRQRDGATAGGIAGAVIGGIIGHQNDEVPEGALIGGAVGAIAGGLLGQAQDQELARQRYYQQQTYYQQRQQLYAQQQAVLNAGVSMADVVNMSRSGVSEAVIIDHVRARGVRRRLEVNEIISMHQQGVRDTVISAMQAAPLATEVRAPVPAAPVIVQQPPVIVREQPYVYQSPIVVERHYRAYPAYRHHHYHHRPGTSIRIGF